jgi:hypothetical protein
MGPARAINNNNDITMVPETAIVRILRVGRSFPTCLSSGRRNSTIAVVAFVIHHTTLCITRIHKRSRSSRQAAIELTCAQTTTSSSKLPKIKEKIL